MKRRKSGSILLAASMIIFCFISSAKTSPEPSDNDANGGSSVMVHYYNPEIKTVIGAPERHVIKRGETFLDIARDYGLGYNEIEGLYPEIDPWIPPVGMEIVLPSQWVLPGVKERGVIINTAELRLYYFKKKGVNPVVMTFPIGIGDRDFPTPGGKFKVGEKRKNPTWYVPPSLREKHGTSVIPPGPGNPLGDYWIRLGSSNYGIHGTENPWSVGRLATHGCIRLYPEDIKHLYNSIPHGTPVEIVYEPVKLGVLAGRIYTEVHRDFYDMIDDFHEYGYQRLLEEQIDGRVDMEKFRSALERRDGMPTDITLPDAR